MYKVLIVDDEIINHALMEKIIDWTGYGFEIVGYAEDGLEALQKYETLAPDLIFMDIQLPLQDGLETIRCIREVDRDVRIVIISAYGDFSYAQKAIRYGVQDFILKPVSRIVLNQTVAKIRQELEKTMEQKHSVLENELSGKIMEAVDTQKEPDLPGDLNMVKMSWMNPAGYYVAKKELEACVKKPALQDLLEGMFLALAVVSDGIMIGIPADGFSWETFRQRMLDENRSIRKGILYHAPENGKLLPMLEEPEYGFYSGTGDAYRFGEIKYSCRKYSITEFEELVQKALTSDSCEYLLAYMDQIREQAIREKIEPHRVKDFLLDCLLSIKYYLNKFDAQHSFSMMRNLQLDAINQQQDAECLFDFIKEKIRMAFQDIHSFYLQPEKSLVFRANAFIEQEFCNPGFSALAVADYLGMSKNYFTTQYKEQAGSGFWDYVTKLRMEKAKSLLLNTDEKSGVICHMVGYESEYHFSRKFKQYTGKSPNTYRKVKKDKSESK